MSQISPKDLFDYACSKYLDYSKAVYGAWDAKIVFENRRGTLIEGYNLEFINPSGKARVSLWTHKTDETCLVSYQNRDGTCYTTFHDISLKEELIEEMHKALDEARQSGSVIITKMS